MGNKVKIISHAPHFFELWDEEYAEAAPPSDPGHPLFRTGSAAFDSTESLLDAASDPVGENALSPVPFLVRKYVDRALFLATSKCFFHCRFCFRRGSASTWRVCPSLDDVDNASRWISGHGEIEEVIISGGDPLTLANDQLSALFKTLARAPNLKKLRVHTKAPVVRPSRIDAGLIKTLSESPLPVSIVLHATHPAEIRASLIRAIDRLKPAADGIYCQTVLLNGVNDDEAVLAELFSGLARLGVKARYLHHTDHAPGTANFWVPVTRGLEIASGLKRLAGHDAPPYVLDLPDGSGKTPVSALAVHETIQKGGKMRVRYRWERPDRWKGVKDNRECFFWDMWEPVRDSGFSV